MIKLLLDGTGRHKIFCQKFVKKKLKAIKKTCFCDRKVSTSVEIFLKKSICEKI